MDTIPQLDFINHFNASDLFHRIQRSSGLLLGLLDHLMIPLSEAFETTPSYLIDLLQKQSPKQSIESFDKLPVYPAKIRDFVLVIKELIDLDKNTISKIYGPTFLDMLNHINYLIETPVKNYLEETGFNFTEKDLLFLQDSFNKYKTDNALGFVFRALIFSQSLFPIYSDPYKAPVGYLKLPDSIFKPGIFHCPIPYYDEVLGLYPAFIQILLLLFQSTLVKTSSDARNHINLLYTELEKTKEELKIAGNNKYVEFVSPYNWS